MKIKIMLKTIFYKKTYVIISQAMEILQMIR